MSAVGRGMKGGAKRLHSAFLFTVRWDRSFIYNLRKNMASPQWINIATGAISGEGSFVVTNHLGAGINEGYFRAKKITNGAP